ncbi:MAG: hypothetical protein JO036_05760 [Candidatus Eremiobacteraeota bacterium]|nr:hypothetical protein [Candidatus Eremiobacteraeota bacterium]
MNESYEDLISFVTTDSFVAVCEEMNALPPEVRPVFVKAVLLNPDELRKRGVIVPEDILIQRSAFGDRRPTLFAIKKFLPERYHDSWENVNLTFDNPYEDAAISRNADVAWRPPLPVELQADLMTHGADMESVGSDFEIQAPAFGGSNISAFPSDRLVRQGEP